MIVQEQAFDRGNEASGGEEDVSFSIANKEEEKTKGKKGARGGGKSKSSSITYKQNERMIKRKEEKDEWDEIVEENREPGESKRAADHRLKQEYREMEDWREEYPSDSDDD